MDNDGEIRMAWWHEAKFGMFVHWASAACLAGARI